MTKLGREAEMDFEDLFMVVVALSVRYGVELIVLYFITLFSFQSLFWYFLHLCYCNHFSIKCSFCTFLIEGIHEFFSFAST